MPFCVQKSVSPKIAFSISTFQFKSKSSCHNLVTEKFKRKCQEIFLSNDLVKKFTYCRIQRNWRLGLSSISEARGSRISMKILQNNLALICIDVCQLKIFLDHRCIFWSGKKIKWGGFLTFFRDGQLVRNCLCYESCQKNIFGYLFCW